MATYTKRIGAYVVDVVFIFGLTGVIMNIISKFTYV